MNSGRFTISTDQYKLSVNSATGTWSLSSGDANLHVKDASVDCIWHQAERTIQSRVLLNPQTIEKIDPEELGVPGSAGFRFQSEGAEHVTFTTELVLGHDAPFCFMRIKIQNSSPASIRLGWVNFLSSMDPGNRLKNSALRGVRLFREADKDMLRFFGHGWQSWSFAGVLKADEKFPRSKLGPLSAPMQLCWGHRHPKQRGRFISDFYGALFDTRSRNGLLLGFLSQEIAFGRLEVELSQSGSLCALWQNFESVRLPPGGTFISDWACIHAFDLDATHAFDHYLELVASVGDVGRIRESISGWCSWYYYGQDISNEDMRQEFDWITDHRDRLPLDLFQIDDGYQTNIGDWEQHDERFPEPLAYFSNDIRAASLTPGLWMAPLIASGDSKLMAQHPEWLLRDGRGKPVSAGFGWGRFFHALDGSHPGFIYEMKTWVGRAVSDWGFDYLKLDFLYAGALPGQRYDDTKTGAMVLRDVLEVIRFAAGDHTFLVGCGCPVGTGLGLVDSMRISPDVSEHWRGRYKGIPLLVSRDPGFPSAWNAIRNTYYRAHQHRLWWLNDPDCLILRSGNSSLSEDEMQSLVTMIALGGGVILDSDRLCALSDDRKAILARLIPPINRRPIQPTFFQPEKPAILVQHFEGAVGKWSLVAIFNFEETPKKTTLQRDLLGIQTGGIISGFDFWDQRILHFDGMSWDIGSIPAHGVKLLALRAQNGGPLWIGDTIHISQGNCVSEWSDKDNKLFAVIESGRIGTEKIWLDIPGTVRSVTIDGEPIDDIEYQDGMILFEIQLEHHNKLALEWR